MRKFTLSIFIFFFANTSNAQALNEEELIGSWKVVHVLNEESNENLKELMRSFETVIFQFTQLHEFKLTSNLNTELFIRFADITKNSYWKLNPEKQILIGNSENNYSVIKIGTQFENEKIIFTFEETPIRLEVQRN